MKYSGTFYKNLSEKLEYSDWVLDKIYDYFDHVLNEETRVQLELARTREDCGLLMQQSIKILDDDNKGGYDQKEENFLKLYLFHMKQ
jgi:hypothetical protein